MQPLVPLVFHNFPSLYPPSFIRNIMEWWCKEYSELCNDEKVPIRLMAPESISGELYNED